MSIPLGQTKRIQTLRAQAARRRRALVNAGCATYIIGRSRGAPCIRCLCCGLASFNPHDIEQRYCGFCHAWHSEEKEKP